MNTFYRSLIGGICALSMGVAMQANAALVSRLGGAAAYDTVLNITWATNAALSDLHTWNDQVAWASGLSYLGYDDWRLAATSVSAGLPTGTRTSEPVDCSTATEQECRDNELGYMFYYNLGGSFNDDLTGDQTRGDVTLTGIQDNYWSATEWSTRAWGYRFGMGYRSFNGKGVEFDGWAVRAGDVAAVPVPAAVWLFGSGLVVLLGLSRRK